MAVSIFGRSMLDHSEWASAVLVIDGLPLYLIFGALDLSSGVDGGGASAAFASPLIVWLSSVTPPPPLVQEVVFRTVTPFFSELFVAIGSKVDLGIVLTNLEL